MPQADVTVHTTFLGGGFGRRAEVDLVRQAVTCALADARAAGPGPVVARGGHPPRLLPADGAGALAGRTRVVDRQRPSSRASPSARSAQSPTDQFGARAVGLPAQGKPEGNAVENPPYAFPFYRLDAVVPTASVPVGFWRSVGHSHTAFFDESFIDELALASEEGSVRVPPRAAGRQAAPSARCWRRAAQGGGLGHAAAGRHRAAASRCAPRSARSWRRSPRSR